MPRYSTASQKLPLCAGAVVSSLLIPPACINATGINTAIKIMVEVRMVVIHNKENNKGKIEIDYGSREEFERIMELIEKK